MTVLHRARRWLRLPAIPASQPPPLSPDHALALRLEALFEVELAPLALDAMHVYAYRGVVAVYGRVRHQRDAELIETLVRELEGVRQVSLHVRCAEEAPPPYRHERVVFRNERPTRYQLG